MSPAAPADLTTLLLRAGSDPAAAEEVFTRVYQKLREIARRLFARERVGHVLQPTAIVNEACLKLLGPGGRLDISEVKSRGQFFVIAANAMQQVLVDHAREQKALKRGGGATIVSLQDQDLPAATPAVDVLALDDALGRLAVEYPRHARVAKLKFFGGCKIPEIAEALGVSESLVGKYWRFAKAWLVRELSDDERT